MISQENEQVLSRQERVMAAKAAFLTDGNVERKQRGASSLRTSPSFYERNQRSVSVDSGNSPLEEATQENDLQKKHIFRLVRMMTAGMLFLVLVIAFSNGFSYKGFDQAYVQKALEDETSWNRLEQKVQKIYLSLERQWNQQDSSKENSSD